MSMAHFKVKPCIFKLVTELQQRKDATVVERDSAVSLYGNVIIEVAWQLLVMESCYSLRPDKRMSS